MDGRMAGSLEQRYSAYAQQNNETLESMVRSGTEARADELDASEHSDEHNRGPTQSTNMSDMHAPPVLFDRDDTEPELDSERPRTGSSDAADIAAQIAARPQTAAGRAARPRTALGGAAGPAARSLRDELEQLFAYIDEYTPLDIQLDTQLKPFIPPYVAAIGDIDAFVKIPRPDGEADELGLAVLDEPCGAQSDPLALGLKLRAMSKQTGAAPEQIGGLASHKGAANARAVASWIASVRDLHRDKPATAVQYGRLMPDEDELLQAWPAALEATLGAARLPPPEIDLALADLARVYCALLDIPTPAAKGDATDNATVESLHALFSVYAVFKQSQHFAFQA